MAKRENETGSDLEWVKRRPGERTAPTINLIGPIACSIELTV